MVEIPRIPNVKAINPMAQTNAELKKLNENMEKMLDQMSRIQGWLVKIEMNTKHRAS
jgi:hypothetical protein